MSNSTPSPVNPDFVILKVGRQAVRIDLLEAALIEEKRKHKEILEVLAKVARGDFKPQQLTVNPADGTWSVGVYFPPESEAPKPVEGGV